VEYSYCIDSKVLGTRKHFLCRKGTYSWVTDIPSYAWHLSGDLKDDCNLCFDTLLKLNDVELDLLPASKFVNAMETVTSGSQQLSPPWQYLMPKETHKMFSRALVDKVEEIIPGLSQDYYRTVWIPGNRVLAALKRTKIDVERLDTILAAKVGNRKVVETFKPTRGGYASEPAYNRFGTRTGRVTTNGGPSILNLKKEYRNVITSRYGDKGHIVNVDFAALEPRVILYEAGKRCESADLYTMLNEQLFNGEGKRSVIKGSVISLLYGLSKKALLEKLDVEENELTKFMKKIRSYFEADKLLTRVKAEFVKEGHIKNRFGRRVKIDEPLNHIFVNSYAQSVGADISILGFDKIIEKTKDRKIVPLFLLYDAIIMDVHEDDLPFLRLIQRVKVPGYMQSFPITVEEIECTNEL
jgi:hypothetical protein